MVGYAFEAVPASCFCERNIPLVREKVYQASLLKKKLEGPGTIISRDKIKRKWLETTEPRLFHQEKKDVKSTVVARISCTPYSTPSYSQLRTDAALRVRSCQLNHS